MRVRTPKTPMPDCPDCKTTPWIEVEDNSPNLGVTFFVACKCKKGEGGNSGTSAMEKWDAGLFVKREETL